MNMLLFSVMLSCCCVRGAGCTEARVLPCRVHNFPGRGQISAGVARFSRLCWVRALFLVCRPVRSCCCVCARVYMCVACFLWYCVLSLVCVLLSADCLSHHCNKTNGWMDGWMGGCLSCRSVYLSDCCLSIFPCFCMSACLHVFMSVFLPVRLHSV